jgi:integrase
VRRSKTPAGWRTPTLNDVCKTVLTKLWENAEIIGAADPEHHVFPWHGREQKIDPTRPITSWRSAWRSILRVSGLSGVRFHDLRHSAVTILAEAGVADWIIQAQVGHVSPAMMKTYSHVRRQALDQAAAALQPTLRATQKQPKLELVN